MALTRDDVKLNLLPVGITETGGSVHKPAKGTVYESWMLGNTNPTDQLLSVNATAGTVIDLEAVGTLSNQYGGPQATGLGTVILGSFVHTYLDWPASHVIKPMGVPTTF